MKSTLLLTTALLAAIAFSPLMANAQAWRNSDLPLPDNGEIRIERFEWTLNPDKDTPRVAARFILHNKAAQKSIRSARFTVIAKDKKDIVLTERGSALRRLTNQDIIAPEASGTIYFPKVYTLPDVDELVLKEVYVEFSNGSLSIWKAP